MEADVYDAISQVSDLEEKVYVELQVMLIFFFFLTPGDSTFCFHCKIIFLYQRASGLIEAMEKTAYNIEAGLPDLKTFSQKLFGLYWIYLSVYLLYCPVVFFIYITITTKCLHLLSPNATQLHKEFNIKTNNGV